MYRIFLESLAPSVIEGPHAIHWCLDFPQSDAQKMLSADDIQNVGLLFQGWVVLTTELDKPSNKSTNFLRRAYDKISSKVLKNNKQKISAVTKRIAPNTEAFHEQLTVYLRSYNDESDHILVLAELERKRTDVISSIFELPAQTAEEHPLRYCGFRFQTPVHHADFEVGLRYVDESGKACCIPLVAGRIRGVFEVLKGRDDWLFLANDTNQSIAQHTGDILLDAHTKEAWHYYFTQVNDFALRYSTVFIVAPAKEAVYWEQYPYERAKVTAIAEMLNIARESAHFSVLYPVDELRAMAERSYRITDTHWSALGACRATQLLARELGEAPLAVSTVFAKDVYKVIRTSGDLGNKIFPPQKAEEKALKRYSYKNRVIYDNGLANFGRILVLYNRKALFATTLVLFGSSSAYSMLNYLYRLYQHVVLIHSAGNVDAELLTALEPDKLVLQTNSRFVVRAPVANYAVRSDIQAKLAEKGVSERAATIEKAQQFLNADFLDELPLKARALVVTAHRCMQEAMVDS